MNRALVEKLPVSYDIDKLKDEVEQLISNVGIEQSTNQICLMHSTRCQNQWYDGTGNLTLKNQIKQSNLQDLDYSIINKNIADMYLGSILKVLKAQYKICRARIMIMQPKSCYSWHQDTLPRLHIAIKTNEHCRMAFETGTWHIPADGFVYATKTTNFHSAFNGSFDSQRIHLVMSYNKKFGDNK